MTEHKIPILYVMYDLRSGGAERQLVELLKNLDRKRFEPHIACLSRGGHFLHEVEKTGLRIEYTERSWRWDPLPVLKIYRLIRRYDVRVIHSYLFLPTFYTVLAARLARVHSINCSVRSASSHGWIKDRIDKFVAGLSSAVVTNSAMGREFLLRLGVNSPVKVIYNGIDVGRFEGEPDVEAKRKSLGLSGYDLVVGMVANLESRKNPFAFMEVASKLSSEFPTTAFLLVGDGLLLEEVKKRKENDLSLSRLFILGHRDDVDEIMRVFDVFVLTSSITHEEGIPNSVMEAMACAKPVVVTKSGGSGELVVDGETGFLVARTQPEAMAEKVSMLLRDGSLRRGMGWKGFERVRSKFSIDSHLKAMTEMYTMLNSDTNSL